MKGKVFSDSNDIYEDQARILFDFFKQAAEKIVGDEEQYEAEIEQRRKKLVELREQLEKKKTERLITMILFFLIIPIFLAYEAHQAILAIEKEIQALTVQITEFNKLHAEIFRDYQVTNMGVAYVPIAAQLPYEDKSFIIDYTGNVSNQQFNLLSIRSPELFTKAMQDLDATIQTAPIVEHSEEPETVATDDYSLSIQEITYHDYLGKIDRSLRTSSFCLSDVESTSVSLPVVMPNSGYHRMLREYATTRTDNAPVFEVFNREAYQDEIERFHELNEMKKSLEKQDVQFEDVLRNLMVNVADAVQAITKVKVASTHRLVDGSNKTLFNILKCSFNHYSPHLEAEEIERIKNESFNYQDAVENYQPFHLKPSSKLRYDLISDAWVAEDGSKTNFPFGVHQFQEEIVAPIVQNLLKESRLERLKIYNNIKDQKTNYLNQWHQETMDFYGRNRAESNDLINIMRSTLTEYISSYNAMLALKKTQDNLKVNISVDASIVEAEDNEAEVFAAFELKSREFKAVQEDFMDYMDRLKEDIDRRAEKFEHIEYYDASLRDNTFKDYAVANSRVAQLEPRRSALAFANPYLAEQAILPPEPSVEAIAHEHMTINLPMMSARALQELDNQTDNHAAV
jgi:hypothetical protein